MWCLRKANARENKDPGKRGHIVADTNVSRLSARDTFVADTNFVSGTQKMFLILFRTFCVRNKRFPDFAAWKHNIHSVSPAFARPRNIMSNNVSATMCPLLPESFVRDSTRWKWPHNAHSFFAEQKCNLILTNTLNVHQLWHLSNHTQKVQQREKLGFLRGDVNLQEKHLDMRDREHELITKLRWKKKVKT